MTPEQHTALVANPRWIRVLLAVVSGVAVYRVCTLIIGFVLWQSRGSFLPTFLQVFLYRWDWYFVPLTAVTMAVLSARWLEAKMKHKRRSVVVVVSSVLAVVALFPASVRYEVTPVMASPVLIAVERDYPLETVAAMLDRYPKLANASDDDWGRIQPLVEAAYGRKTNMVALLISKGADVDAAVEDLMRVDAKEALILVLTCAKSHNQTVERTGAPPSGSKSK